MNSCFPFQVKEGISTTILNTVGGLKKALQLKPFHFVPYVSTSELNNAYVKNYNINPEIKLNLPVTFLGGGKAFQGPKLKELRR